MSTSAGTLSLFCCRKRGELVALARWRATRPPRSTSITTRWPLSLQHAEIDLDRFLIVRLAQGSTSTVVTMISPGARSVRTRHLQGLPVYCVEARLINRDRVIAERIDERIDIGGRGRAPRIGPA